MSRIAELLAKWHTLEPGACKAVSGGHVYLLYPPSSEGWHLKVNVIEDMAFRELAYITKTLFDMARKKGWLLSTTAEGFAMCVPVGTAVEKQNFKADADTPEEGLLSVYVAALSLVNANNS